MVAKWDVHMWGSVRHARGDRDDRDIEKRRESEGGSSVKRSASTPGMGTTAQRHSSDDPAITHEIHAVMTHNMNIESRGMNSVLSET